MPINYGTPPCPHLWAPREEDRCPRSDTYRAIEQGDAFGVWGFLFRCRTCGNMFFRATREAAVAGMLGKLVN